MAGAPAEGGEASPRAASSREQVASRRRALSADRQALLDSLRNRQTPEGARSKQAEVIPRRSDDGPAPLSFAQERLWFLEQLRPGTAFYNVAMVNRLTGPLSVRVLRAVFGELIRRHESLRTTFRAQDGRPYQLVGPPLAPGRSQSLAVVGLGGLPGGARQPSLEGLAKAEAQRPFDLARGPLHRVRLLRLAADDHVLLLTLHHIICDAWSSDRLLAEVQLLYQAFLAGEPSPLKEPLIRYVDFAVWQRQWLAGRVLEDHLAYWRRQLAGVAALELPLDRPRPAAESFRGGVQALAGSPQLSAGLQALARERGATLFMVVLALCQALCSRLSGQVDIAVGSPVANRSRPEMEEVIGFFANTLVLRTNLAGNPSVRGLLARVQEVALAAYAHQEVPFERLVEELQPERDASRNPLFQVLCVVLNEPRTALSIGDLRLAPLDLDLGAAKFDLSFFANEMGGQLHLLVEYSSDLFDGATARRLVSALQSFLAAAVADAGCRLGDLPLLSMGEKQEVLAEWNDTARPGPPPPAPHRRAEARARQLPERVAAVCGSEHLSQAALHAQAERLARHLRRLGVGPDTLVGISLERGLGMLVAVLAVLKAEAAYVPLDPAYPPQRLTFMLEDAPIRVLLTQSSLAEAIPAAGFVTLCLDSPPTAAAIAAEAPGPRELGGGDDPGSDGEDGLQLAYVIFTSGSTGRPKGVALPRAALANLLQWHLARLLGGAVTLGLASLSFDVSFYEIFLAWCSGGRLLLVPEELRRDIPALARLIRDERAEKVILPVVYLEQLAVEVSAWPEPLPALREVTTTGEQMQITPRVAALFGRLPRASLHNHYGPSESHVVTAHRLPPTPARWVPRPPIGRPIEGVRIHLLDSRLAPVPAGVVGEIHIAGVALARGYLNRPGLTAERFRPDPFGAPGGRLYRSGDRARLLPDGCIEYLGRVDHQVKVRGFRVELGEIEAALLEHAGVREAAVLAGSQVEGRWRPGGGAADRLVAYVVPVAAAELSAADLRRDLADRLPEHMLPGTLVFLPSLPLTPNRKVDLAALPAPEEQPPDARQARAARTATEAALVSLWAEILGLDVGQVGLDDNFFRLGGHSLLVTRLLARVRSAFGVELPVQRFFEAPTVATLAAALGEPGAAAAPPLLPRSPGEEPPLSFAQERLWFLDQIEPGSPAYNMPMALRLEGELEVAALAASLRQVRQRHAVLRTTFQRVEGQPKQRIHRQPALPLPLVDLSALADRERSREALSLAHREAQGPFDLARGPLVRARLLRLGREEHWALFTLHHIIADGWSLGALTRELGALYRGLSLPPLPVQYGDFAAWQRRWLAGEVLEAQLAYWRQQLAGAPTLLSLPTDRPRPPLQTFRGAVRSFALSAPLAREIEALARRQGATPFMVLLAAFFVLLGRISGQGDVLVGSPVANRGRAELEGLVGLFVNNLVLRGDLAGSPSFRELLARVRRALLAAHAHQDLPFERLVDELQVPRSLSHHPLYQVVFSYLSGELLRRLELPGLTLEPVALAEETAKVDLLLAAGEGEEGIGLALQYSADLFDPTTVERLGRGLRALLGGAVTLPERQIGDLPMLAAGERWQLLGEWNDLPRRQPAGREGGEEMTLPRLFARQAAARGAEPAVVFRGASQSYGELAGRAGALARRLQRLGVGPETVVAVAAPRGPELLAGMLGTWLAGGAYLPLDPAYPAERLAFLLADSDAALVLATPEIAGALPAHALPLIELPAGGDAGEGAAGEPARATRDLLALAEADPENLAWVIYTSGSTGRPNGVGISHRAAANLLIQAREHFRVGPESRVLSQVSPSFDASLLEVGLALLSGACLVVAGEAERLSGPALTQLLREQGVDTAVLTPAVLGLLDPAELPGLSTLSVGGEACSRELAARWTGPGDGSGRLLLNCYGPTEATIYASVERVNGGSPGPPTLGRPVAGAAAWVVDRRLDPVPAGIAGELVLGGQGLGRGYLGRPALTAGRFLPNPFAAGPGERLYRTGDLVRRLADGRLDFLGRVDFQVKLRGLRLELGEIEAALLAHPGVAEAAVVAGRMEEGAWRLVDGGPAERLVAYAVPAEGTPPAEAELRQDLASRLPAHLVPGSFVFLPELPRTPVGKVDRRALPAPDPGPEQGYAPPRDELELRLAALWAEVLELPRVGIRSGFFALGGHSLLAVRLLARVSEELGRELPLTALFTAGTVEAMAELLRREGATEGGSLLVPIRPAGDERPLFLVHPAGGDVLCFAALAGHLPQELPVYGLQSRGLADGAEPLATVEAMAGAYVEALRGLQPAGPYRLGGWSLGGAVAYEMARLLRAGGDEVEALLVIDTTAGMGDGGPEPPSGPDDPLLLGEVLTYVESLWDRRVEVTAEELALLAPEERLEGLARALASAGLLPAGSEGGEGRGRLRRLLRTYACNLQAGRVFRPGFYSGRITLFRADRSGDGGQEGGSGALAKMLADPTLGWEAASGGQVEVHTLPATHYSLMTEPAVRTLAAGIARCLRLPHRDGEQAARAAAERT